MMPAFLQPFWAEELTMEDTPLIAYAIARRVHVHGDLPGTIADFIDEVIG